MARGQASLPTIVVFYFGTYALKNLHDNCEQWEQLGETDELIIFPGPVPEIESAMKVGMAIAFMVFRVSGSPIFF